ncbi:hypothetical protein N9M01_07375 [Luminiphilus sp.]|nr:hypothetical protein [Luminiphilus sp.]
MLTEKEEIKIISNAKQKNIRDPNRSREPFNRIFHDFFRDTKFQDGLYLDLGAGHYDFGEIVRKKGGECHCVDKDPAVVELGCHKGFHVIEHDIKNINSNVIQGKYDGVFNKFSLNAFWSWREDGRQEELVANLANLVKPEGWAWIAPWNGVPKKDLLSKKEIERVVSLQKELFLSHRFECITLTKRQSEIYGLTGTIENNVIFTKNLNCWI